MPPLPWKKAGISRFVAYQINSAKQGASLVETGFSTSIVDLFVKNREGLKGSSMKNKKKKNRTCPYASESLAGGSTIGDLPLSSCPAFPSKSLISHGSSRIHCLMAPSPTISRHPSPQVWETPRPSFSGSRVPENESFAPVRVEDAVGGDRKSSVRAKKVFVGMLKIVLLVVLALGKKQFAFGMTVTALLLHIMEFLGKCMCRLLKHCQVAHFSFRHFLEQVVCNPSSKNEIEVEPACSIEEDSSSIEDQTIGEGEGEEEEEEANSSFPDFGFVNETQHMDWISGLIMDERAEEEQWDYCNKNPKNRKRNIKSKIKKLWISKKKQEDEYPISDSDGEEEEQQQEVADEKSLKNLSKDIKAKINKIIPKKLKNSKRKKKQKYQTKNTSVFNERFEEETESQSIIDNLYEQDSRASSSKLDEDDDQILPFNDDDKDTSFDEGEREESPKREDRVNVCEKQTMCTTKGNSLVFLMPIILIGLENGRFWAILFTMVCCLVWKLVTMSSKFFQLLVAHL